MEAGRLYCKKPRREGILEETGRCNGGSEPKRLFLVFRAARSGEDSPCYTSPGTKKVHNGDLDRGVQDQRTHPGTGNLKNCPADCPALSAFQSRAELVSGSRHRTPGAALFRSDPGKTNGRRASDQCLCFPD